MPSTLLAQVDSSIGGKTGINNKFGKNLVGSFYQPEIVITDVNVLKKLPQREIICGYAEIFKASLIDSIQSFAYLDKNLNDDKSQKNLKQYMVNSLSTIFTNQKMSQRIIKCPSLFLCQVFKDRKKPYQILQSNSQEET